MRTRHAVLIVTVTVFLPALLVILTGFGKDEPSAHDYEQAHCLLEVALDHGTNADAEACRP